jgi:lipopolysaccharide transport system ATP-binding protein
MSIVIKAENISKQYKLGAVGISNLKDDAQRLVAKLLGKEDPFLKLGSENRRDEAITGNDSKFVWALRDVNFEIKQGEAVGIIGKNGAGKSTLLKILSRVTEPTIGKLKYKGRLASLLEVGTGFHPDLTGRDNVFLNGAILGMKKEEIARKFDEIVEFSGVAKYIDTPVKRYSSGMYVRLAFAVAAHLDPDILIIDEVLAVGDQEFQNKCVEKMKSVVNQGRTVIFVSHNLPTVKSFCTSGIFMKHGRIIKQDNVNEVINEYLSENRVISETGIIPKDFSRPKVEGAVVTKMVCTSEEGEFRNEFGFGEKIKIEIEFEIEKKINPIALEVLVVTPTGEPLALMSDLSRLFYNNFINPGLQKLELEIDEQILPGNYSLSIGISDQYSGINYDWLENVFSFKVSNVSKNGAIDYPYTVSHGFINLRSKWKIKK